VRKYLGRLSKSDPLYQYLKHDIQPQLTGFLDCPEYRVFQLNGSNAVYLYEERQVGSRMIGKFFLSGGRDHEAATRRLDREQHHLELMRGYGFTGYPHYIARPLGRNDDLGKLLVIEYCQGELLSHVINRAIRTRDDGLLFGKLSALAWFLASFHNRTVNPFGVDFNESCAYFDGLVHRLERDDVFGGNEAGEMWHLRDCWRGQPKMWDDRQVLAHGDATPENFLFGDGMGVVSFDLERLRRADRVYDTGRIAGELKHFFLAATGDDGAAEPFIGHFLWEYACHFPDRERTFAETTRRVPFYMGITLLRIARNFWLDIPYRRRLAHAGKECLRRWTL
jgi:aminoglycoside phosphotransferase (APT) family kinase protein